MILGMDYTGNPVQTLVTWGSGLMASPLLLCGGKFCFKKSLDKQKQTEYNMLVVEQKQKQEGACTVSGLQYIREQFNMSIAALSKKIGISYQAISQWEKGIRQIPAKRLTELATLFMIPEQYFLDIQKTDLDELDILIELAKSNSEKAHLVNEYERLVESERISIEKIKNYIASGKNPQVTLQETNDFIVKEMRRLEKIATITSSPLCSIFDSILDVFVDCGKTGANRTQLVQSLQKGIVAVLEDAERAAANKEWYDKHKEEFDELF